MGCNWAITIGINRYRNLQRLHYAKRDAEAMQSFFHQDLHVDQLYHFSDDSPPIPQDYGDALDSHPTFATLRRFLRVRFESPFLGDGDTLWFFFAGHGIRYEDRDYLMPLDGDPGDASSTAIPLHYVTERLRRCGADNVLLLIDACRSASGRRDGVGVGEEKQQGVITLFSCSPRESSYEIDELQQGAFTHALIESLRLQGEENCATVERLYKRLRSSVPALNQRYQKPQQTPYGLIEPPTKYHLILLPQQATSSDILTLKNDAYRAESGQALAQAKQLWTRTLAIAGADAEAIEGIERLALRSTSQKYSRSTTSSQTAGHKDSTSTSQPTVSEAESKHQLAEKKARVNQSRIQLQHELEMQKLSAELDRIKNQHREKQSRYDLEMQCQQAGHQGFISEMNRGRTLPGVEVELLLPGKSSFEFETVTINAYGQETARHQRRAHRFVEDVDGILLEILSIPGGTFSMGSSERKPSPNEQPTHEVTVKPFWMSKYPITKAQWRAIANLSSLNRPLKKLPSRTGSATYPITYISWYEAVEFCDRLSQKTGHQYRLPTEAEWEYACRAGTTTPFHYGATITSDLANFDGTYVYHSEPKGANRGKLSPIKSFPFANAFGLFDMHGNAWEWCMDHWHDNYNCAPTTGEAWLDDAENLNRVIRGGSWTSDPLRCRSACRQISDVNHTSNNTGFRVVCSL